MHTFLDFERPVTELEGKIAELRHLSSASDLNIAEEVARLQSKLDTQLRQIYSKLTPWQKVQVARHFDRPHSSDYLKGLVEDFVPLAGDRAFADDLAMLGGIGRLRGYSALFIGQEKGSDTDSRVRHSFGMARPEGYRKAERLMRLADHFRLPIITFVDTPGAYPGVDAEARGQAEAIASCIETCFNVRVPLISVIIGEGGSGGAMALAAGNQVVMLEHAIYSVISPEGCASILWRNADQAKTAAQALKMTATDLKRLGVVDRVIEEPLGGAHRDPSMTVQSVGDVIEELLQELIPWEEEALLRQRRERFLRIDGNV